ncbi:ABC transporter substrate-binding protein [Xylanimonas ulmi]|uniref:Amino acid/amide ABC transporter substrate-binding protein (HAAT family) n=1 Tax=Xylanimonas ulmi TaxID=228973 RepID=A0A4Q7M678_9MICO|nr:ABC transporter substrate-binding protein [Xylanibacterium ulmi]RZS61559.1 amino acid/amide ABC transporter substrate-binding protein (HAAT family) [Xylanibacterium ulmi]
MKKLSASLAITALTTATLAGCGGRDDSPAEAGDDCAPGITDSQVRIGSSLPASGPAAAYGAIAAGSEAYFDAVNAAGGVAMGDGVTRQVVLTTMDDAYDSARTVSNVRKLVEQDDVAALMNVLGTSPNAAIADYVTEHKIPNLFAMTGTDQIGEQASPPWTQAFMPQYALEAEALGGRVLEINPNAKIAILYQNDGYGKNMLADFTEFFAGTGVTIVAEQSYEQTASSIDSQMANLAASDADMFLDYATGAFMTQSLRKRAELGWQVPTIITSASGSVETIIKPAGEGAADGVITTSWLKDVSAGPGDDPGVKAWWEFAQEHGLEARDNIASNGYTTAQLMVEVLERTQGCTSQDIRAAAFSLDGARADLLLEGITVSTSEDYPYMLTTVGYQEFRDGGWRPDGATHERQR